MSDRQEITDLVYRLSVALDEGRFEDMREILTEDATVRTPGGTAEGIDALIAQASRNHTPGQRIQHVITNVLVDVDGGGNQASVRANLVVTFAVEDGEGLPEPHLTLGEVYRFAAARTPQGWRLTRVETTPLWRRGEIPV